MRYKGLWYNPDKPEPERIEHDNTIFIFSFVFSSFRAFVIKSVFIKCKEFTAKALIGSEISFLTEHKNSNFQTGSE